MSEHNYHIACNFSTTVCVSTKSHSHLFTVKANLNETKTNKLRLEQNGENYWVVIIDSCLVNLEVARMGRNH